MFLSYDKWDNNILFKLTECKISLCYNIVLDYFCEPFILTNQPKMCLMFYNGFQVLIKYWQKLDIEIEHSFLISLPMELLISMDWDWESL